MPSSTRYWGTLLVAEVLTVVLSVILLVAGVVPVWIPIVGIAIACPIFVWSVGAFIRKSPPR